MEGTLGRGKSINCKATAIVVAITEAKEIFACILPSHRELRPRTHVILSDKQETTRWATNPGPTGALAYLNQSLREALEATKDSILVGWTKSHA